MLLELKVENFAIISSLLFMPSSGLNVLSGETGAGKSLIADALAALILGKTDDELIKSSADSAKINGLFTTSGSRRAKINKLLQNKGLSVDAFGQLVLACEIKRAGRSSFRINGDICSRTVMQEVGSLLVDIHGQSDHLSLLNTASHLEILDRFSLSTAQSAEYGEHYKTLKANIEYYKSLQAAAQERIKQADFLTFQLNEIRQARLKDGEEEELTTRKNVLTATDSIKSACFDAYHLLNGERMGNLSVENNTAQAAKTIERLTIKDPSLKELAERLRAAALEISDCAGEIHNYADALEFSPAALEETENRLSIIRALKRKYGIDIAAILKKENDLEKELNTLNTVQQDLQNLRSQIKLQQASLGDLGEKLLKARQGGALALQSKVENELKDLNMPDVLFKVDFMLTIAPNGLPFSDGQHYVYNENGIGAVQFLIKTNPGEDFKPLNKIASTGEMSRFTLALKSALADIDSTPTLVFDEIDIGVGARSGHILGRKIYCIACNRQVICVTHLAQIAAYAQSHFTVRKESADGFTQSNLRQLSGQGVLNELAIMLSGTQSTIKEQAAREVLAEADEYKARG